SEIFSAGGRRYAPPRLTLFSDAVDSACGYNTAAGQFADQLGGDPVAAVQLAAKGPPVKGCQAVGNGIG
ncbi:MAG: hypothetical protein RLT05_14420, partial [Bauldia litoralis]